MNDIPMDRYDTVVRLEVILELLKRRAIGVTMRNLEELIQTLKEQDALDTRAYCLDQGLPAHLFNH